MVGPDGSGGREFSRDSLRTRLLELSLYSLSTSWTKCVSSSPGLIVTPHTGQQDGSDWNFFFPGNYKSELQSELEFAGSRLVTELCVYSHCRVYVKGLRGQMPLYFIKHNADWFCMYCTPPHLQKMEASGYLHSPAALPPGREPPVSIEEVDGCRRLPTYSEMTAAYYKLGMTEDNALAFA